MKAEFVQLAHKYVPTKHSCSGAWISEKLDGVRAVWDGGISRGVPTKDVPYANTVKDHRLLKPPVATGLWSRMGRVVSGQPPRVSARR